MVWWENWWALTTSTKKWVMKDTLISTGACRSYLSVPAEALTASCSCCAVCWFHRPRRTRRCAAVRWPRRFGFRNSHCLQHLSEQHGVFNTKTEKRSSNKIKGTNSFCTSLSQGTQRRGWCTGFQCCFKSNLIDRGADHTQLPRPQAWSPCLETRCHTSGRELLALHLLPPPPYKPHQSPWTHL